RIAPRSNPPGMSETHQPPDDSPERRADAPHRGNRSAISRLEFDAPSPSAQLGRDRLCPATVERLEMLDDLVFEAIAGKPGSVEQLRSVWPQTLAELGRELLEESRAQYLRHAISVWQDCIAADEISNPRLAIAAIDVLCVLLEESPAPPVG
ncbi:MAG TPA: hypothetical protein VHY20_05020, partial [Pirellulales bacterium]|nr:hypothetical protein [Pirellulales bacterium]